MTSEKGKRTIRRNSAVREHIIEEMIEGRQKKKKKKEVWNRKRTFLKAEVLKQLMRRAIKKKKIDRVKSNALC